MLHLRKIIWSLMINFFKKIVHRADEFFCTKQIDTFLAWTIQKKVSHKALVLISLPSQSECIQCISGHRVKQYSPDDWTMQFVICEPGKLRRTLIENGYVGDTACWHELFFSPELEIWENKSVHTKILPLRFGFSLEEQRLISSALMSAIEGKFNAINNRVLNVVSNSRLQELATVDVIMWVNGVLRGSIIVEETPFIDAVIEAGLRSMQDKRFKPITKEEIHKMEIEIHWISDLRIPISQQELKASWPVGRKGYVAEHQDQKGWYVPAMFNLMKFDDTSHVLKHLLKNKTRIPESLMYEATTKSYMTTGFIGPEPILVMDGPVAKQQQDEQIEDTTLIESLKVSGDAAASFLVNLQWDDGYMPLYIDPLSKRFGGMDWIRMALSVHALVEYGNERNNEAFLSTARKGISFLTDSLEKDTTLSIQMRAAVLMSLGNAHYGLQNTGQVKTIEMFLQKNLHTFTYGSIFAATLASFFAKSTNEQIIGESIRIAHTTFKDFQTKRDANVDIGSADYPELLNTFFLLEKRLHDRQYSDMSLELENWLIETQMSTGAFRASRRLPYPYARGTAKILEVLSLNYERNRDVLRKAVQWLSAMQYTKENLYFTEGMYKEKSVGGFRSSYTNTEAWIDGPGHFLLGAQRILSTTRDLAVDK